ncbi:MAG: 2-oxoacid ferredoxin oxidoreductase, partial [Nitrospirae bacterium]
PTSGTQIHSKTQPFGVLSEPMNPLALAVAMDCSFVARGFAGDRDQLKSLMKEAINHNGFALVDILQPCVTFNKVNTYEWYSQRVKPVGPEYDPSDRIRAFELALRWGDEIPTGIIYRKEKPTMEEKIPLLKEGPLFRRPFSIPEEIRP